MARKKKPTQVDKEEAEKVLLLQAPGNNTPGLPSPKTLEIPRSVIEETENKAVLSPIQTYEAFWNTKLDIDKKYIHEILCAVFGLGMLTENSASQFVDVDYEKLHKKFKELSADVPTLKFVLSNHMHAIMTLISSARPPEKTDNKGK